MMRFRGVAGLVALAAVASHGATAAPERLGPEKIARIDAFVEARMAELSVPGAAIALIEDGAVVHARGFGVSGPDGSPVGPGTPFLIGSITKSVTALAVMTLVADGSVALDDPAAVHLPGAGLSDAVTVRHLLSHRSGYSTFDGNRRQGDTDATDDALQTAAAWFAGVPLAAAPGERFAYSNANYVLAGALIEAVSGQSYEAFVRERILAPLAMTDSGFGPRPGSAEGHRYWFMHPVAFAGEDGRAMRPQGGLAASARDLGTYVAAYLAATAPTPSPAMRAAMLEVGDATAPVYGLGWFVQDTPDYRLVFHTGSNPGFTAVAGFSPDARFGFVALANAGSSFGMRDIGALTRGVGDLVMDREPAPASPPLGERAAFAAISAVPAVLFVWIAMFVRKVRRGAFVPLRWPGLVLRLVAPSLLLAAAAYALFVAAPAAGGGPWTAAWLFQPDVALMLAIGAAGCGLWALVRAILRLRV